VARSRYDWTGFALHLILGAMLGAVFGLGFRLMRFAIPLELPAFLSARSTWAEVLGWAIFLGVLGGIFRNKLWFWLMRGHRWSRD